MNGFTAETWNSLFRYIAAGVLLGIFTYLVVKGLASAQDLVSVIITLLTGLGVIHGIAHVNGVQNSVSKTETKAVTNNVSTSANTNTSNTN